MASTNIPAMLAAANAEEQLGPDWQKLQFEYSYALETLNCIAPQYKEAVTTYIAARDALRARIVANDEKTNLI